ncbi:site-specific DNA-methyltransferase [Ideonella sp. 4Y16]|uniref:site-specific DNA-methyltransferase n=1 Tax=Ideonella alba TaxID=2824118 RepID=UPI001B38643B|nr:site-specific DNA-methyltransferase [Ideonella alba]MBQ0942980.1 site-specific DNA-methyltransferase [Ideonella alba]
MSKHIELVAKLREIFQIDRPDLDFGIYRILNTRAAEINAYLEQRLPEKVKAALAQGSAAQQEQVARELQEKEAQYQADGIDPGTVPKVRELREKLAQYQAGASEHENAVFSHLLAFFSRYYKDGDFISQRRYKGDTYAIPYAGEEVMLHWANKDQYYTKSGENFANYSFKLDDGRTVHFRLVAADTAKDNRKDNDKERRFALIARKTVTRVDGQGGEVEEELLPVEEVDGASGKELLVRFEYAPQPKGTRQDALVQKAVAAVLADEAVKARWLALAGRAPTEKDPQRTLIEKHLSDYTTKNTADYFIHKDLGGFLRRELDFYIKNEVMNLDDVQNASAFGDIEKSLRMIQCLRGIALELITFLSQLEDFQKVLWLKQKFDISTEIFGKSQDAEIRGLLVRSENSNALRLLSPLYSGRIKCIYIDPPYNTEGDTFLYKDRYKRSSWLCLLQDRLRIAGDLLSEDGILYISIDDKELERLKELCVSLFGRENVINTFSIKTSDPSGHKTVNPSPYSCVEYVLMIAKNRSRYQYKTYSIPAEYDPNYKWYITNIEQPYREWKIESAFEFVAQKLGHDSARGARSALTTEGFNAKVAEFCLENSRSVFQLTAISKDAGAAIVAAKSESEQDPDKIMVVERESADPVFITRGRQIYFYSNKIKKSPESLDEGPCKPLTNLWSDIPWNGISKEGGVELKNGKKPEKLLYRLLKVANVGPEDIVMDFFLGSGTTAAAASKIGCRWIGIESSKDIFQIAKTRIDRVINGDSSGISALSNVEFSGYKCIDLESYEDTLNNLQLRRTSAQGDILNALSQQANDDYLLNYLLEVESRGSLLSVDDFRKPFDYTLNVAVDSAGAFEPRKIDLVETFNFLIGLRVKHIDAQPQRGFVTVTGNLPSGETCLVLWRDCEKLDYEGITKLCDKLAINPADNEYDVVYINGDHNIPTVLTQTAEEGGATRVLKLRQIEPEFLERMFSTEDV